MKKELGQIFTPSQIASYMVDLSSVDLLSSKIIEPSFGEGVFLLEILSRILSLGREKGLSNFEISSIIEKNVFGIELDPDLYKKTLDSVNLFLKKNNLSCKLNLFLGDTLELYKDFLGKFDLVIGNPPYVKNPRLNKRFKFSQGITNLYTTFFEIGINLLSPKGKLCFITPNTWLKNSSQKEYRRFLFQTQLINLIYDFGSEKVFDADTYTCITILSKIPSNCVTYARVDKDLNCLEKRELPWSWFLGKDKWCFNVSHETEYLNKIGNLVKVSYGCTTNLDRVFVGEYKEGLFNGIPLEKSILRKCVKASTFKGETNSYILFPYKDDLKPYTEEELVSLFPLAYKYLIQNKDILEKRDMKGDWFLFGRTQGLSSVPLHKLSLSPIFHKESSINTYYVEPYTVIYSGLMLSSPDFELLLRIKKELSLPRFKEWCISNGKNYGNGFLSISAEVVRKYPISLMPSSSLLSLL